MAALLLRHSRNTLRDVYRARPPYCLRPSRNTSRDVYRAAILFAESHSSAAWLPSNCCKQTPYCLQHARHNIKGKRQRRCN
jgi:hypothetical protein